MQTALAELSAKSAALRPRLQAGQVIDTLGQQMKAARDAALGTAARDHRTCAGPP